MFHRVWLYCILRFDKEWRVENAARQEKTNKIYNWNVSFTPIFDPSECISSEFKCILDQFLDHRWKPVVYWRYL